MYYPENRGVCRLARYKVLKSVAHNVGHSFTSLMNYAGDDYVMGHLLTFARLTGRDTLSIDFVTGEAGPNELLRPSISEVPVWYTKMFWDLVQRHGSDRSLVRNATLTLRYDIHVEQPVRFGSGLIESPYVCDVRITDIRGKEYAAHFSGWWFPEKVTPRESTDEGLAMAPGHSTPQGVVSDPCTCVMRSKANMDEGNVKAC